MPGARARWARRLKTNALRVRSTTPESVPAFIQTRGVDPAGRPIAFVFAGHSRRRSGFVGLLPPARMRRSLNARLLRAGLAYPCFYEGLPIPLRGALAGMAAKAVSSGLGLWSLDATGTRLRVRGVAALEKVALWPKLFRRLVAYFEDGGKGLAGLPAWLAAAPEERDDEVTVLSTGERTRLSAILDVEEGALAMKVPPVDLVIRPR